MADLEVNFEAEGNHVVATLKDTMTVEQAKEKLKVFSDALEYARSEQAKIAKELPELEKKATSEDFQKSVKGAEYIKWVDNLKLYQEEEHIRKLEEQIKSHKKALESHIKNEEHCKTNMAKLKGVLLQFGEVVE